jgi:hypothetical protein
VAESESNYKAALEAIASGKSWESFVANSALKKRRGLKAFLDVNLAPVATIVVAASGLYFGIVQFNSSRSQKQFELKTAKVETLQKLIPTLTSTAADQRRYGLAALVQLAKTFDRTELFDLAGGAEELGDLDAFAAVARLLNDVDVNKRVAELYAVRSERTRHNVPKTEESDVEYQKRINAVLADAQRALSFDSDNARAIYQVAVVQKDSGDYINSFTKFVNIPKLIDDRKYLKDDNHNLNLRSYLYQVECLFSQDNSMSQRVCNAYHTAKSKYRDAGLEDEIKKELTTYEDACH